MTTIQALNDLCSRILLISNQDLAKIGIEIEHHIRYLEERHPNISPDVIRLKFINSFISVLIEHQKAIISNLK